jgi:hypothetical protein
VSRFARKVDANQAAIVEVMRAGGALVVSIAAVGRGVPDLLVGCGGQWRLVEVKDGKKVASARRLTPLEEAFAASAHVHGLRVEIVNNTAEALALVNAWRQT